MERDIPGFYFDRDKKKYYRIQPAHEQPAGVKYSEENVKREKKESKKRKRRDAFEAKRHQQLVTRSTILNSPLAAGISHERATGYQNTEQTKDAQSRAYGEALEPIVRFDVTGLGGQTLRQIQRQWDGYDTAGRHASVTALDPGDSLLRTAIGIRTPARSVLFEDAKYAIDAYSYSNPILHDTIWAMDCVPGHGIRIMATRSMSDPPSMAQIGIMKPSVLAGTQWRHGPASVWAQFFHFTGTPKQVIYSLACNRLGDPTTVVAGSCDGLQCLYSAAGDWACERGCPTDADVYSVDWLSAHVAVAGLRTGGVLVWDRRADEHALRLRHADVVTGVRRAGSDTRLVACGLTHALNLYDLRMVRDYTPPPAAPPAPLPDVATAPPAQTYRLHQRNWQQRRPAKPSTQPVLRFDYANATLPTGLGFDVCEVSNLVAASGERGGVQLYSLRTGCKVPTRQVSRVSAPGGPPVDEPVTHLRFQKDPEREPALFACTEKTVWKYT